MNPNKIKAIWVLGVMLSVTIAKAQINEGVIKYEYRIDMHRGLTPEQEELKKMIPQHRIENYYLFFNPIESHYKQVEDDDAALAANQGGNRMRMRQPKSETYIHKGDRKIIRLQEFMGKNYLITDSLELIPWKMGNEYMEIEGFVCHMAYYSDTAAKQEITAWFTVQIQPFLGPDKFASLPGTILALDINNGERVWVARSIETRAIKPDEIKKPEKGEKISREAFQILVDEQLKRMGARPGSFRF